MSVVRAYMHCVHFNTYKFLIQIPKGYSFERTVQYESDVCPSMTEVAYNYEIFENDEVLCEKKLFNGHLQVIVN